MQVSLPLTGLRILIVDDDDDSRFYISTVLETDGATVTAVASAATALEVLPQWQPHVLICDIAMPEEDGYTLMRKVRALEVSRGGQVPAVALTAYAEPKDRIQALEVGFQKHVTKPVAPGDLVLIIANLIGASRG